MIGRGERKMGAMKLPSMRGRIWDPEVHKDEVKRRQALAARRTNELRRQKTRRKILRAVYSCFRNGLEPKPENIASIAHISRSTVYRHINYVRGLVREVDKNAL